MRNFFLAALLAAFSSMASATPLGLIDFFDEASHHMDEVVCLADTIYFEARGETRLGRQAVAHVTINRSESRHFPETICAVVHFRKGSTCAYSWTCNRQPIRDEDAYEDAIEMAWTIYKQRVLEGKNDNVTHGSTHFHNQSVSNPWEGYRQAVVIGSHTFYRRGRG
jgi:spore germination cell wall hydrolase CwlJ-like protein